MWAASFMRSMSVTAAMAAFSSANSGRSIIFGIPAMMREG